jgi:hypothetical protein
MRERCVQWLECTVGPEEVADTAVMQSGAKALRIKAAVPSPPTTAPVVAPITVARR